MNDKNVTPTDLVRTAVIAYPTASKIYKGGLNVKAEIFLKVCKALDISPCDAYSEIDQSKD